jgi:hypothetical protein
MNERRPFSNQLEHTCICVNQLILYKNNSSVNKCLKFQVGFHSVIKSGSLPFLIYCQLKHALRKNQVNYGLAEQSHKPCTSCKKGLGAVRTWHGCVWSVTRALLWYLSTSPSPIEKLRFHYDGSIHVSACTGWLLPTSHKVKSHLRFLWRAVGLNTKLWKIWNGRNLTLGSLTWDHWTWMVYAGKPKT